MRYITTWLSEQGFKHWKIILQKVLELDRRHLTTSHEIYSCSGMFKEPEGSSIQGRAILIKKHKTHPQTPPPKKTRARTHAQRERKRDNTVSTKTVCNSKIQSCSTSIHCKYM